MYICAVFTLDGSNQSHRQPLCRHCGRQLHNNWTETSWQFWKEVRFKHILNTSVLSIRALCLLHPIYVFPSEYYVTMVKWVTQERLSVRWVNRAQNTSILSLCDVTASVCTKVRRSFWVSRLQKCTVTLLKCSFSSWSFRNTWWHQRSGLIVWWVRHSWRASSSLISPFIRLSISCFRNNVNFHNESCWFTAVDPDQQYFCCCQGEHGQIVVAELIWKGWIG